MSSGETVVAVLLVVGTLFNLLAAVGVLRLPDVYTRLSAASKATTLGSGLILIAAAVQFSDHRPTAVRAVSMAVFLLVGTPVAAHMLGRAAYVSGVPLWKGTRMNALEGELEVHATGRAARGEVAPESDERPTGQATDDEP